MVIKANDVEILNLSQTEEKIITNEIHADLFEEDMKRRMAWKVSRTIDESFRVLKKEWDQKLLDNGVESIPTGRDAYAQLVFSQPNYKPSYQ